MAFKSQSLLGSTLSLDPKRTRNGAKILEPPRDNPRGFSSRTVFCLFARGKSNVSFAKAGMMLLFSTVVILLVLFFGGFFFSAELRPHRLLSRSAVNPECTDSMEDNDCTAYSSVRNKIEDFTALQMVYPKIPVLISSLSDNHYPLSN